MVALGVGESVECGISQFAFGNAHRKPGGGYVIGLAIEYLSEHATLPAEARLFIITGFCGALTTFSTFSAEVVTLLSEQRYGWSLVHIASHLFGSVVMTVLGILTVKGLQT